MQIPAVYRLDSYKLGHADQYPEGTTKVYSNFTARSLKHLNIPEKLKDDRVVWVGMQLFLNEMHEIWEEFFNEEFSMEVAEKFFGPFCGPNGFNAKRLKALHELDYIPLCIKALPEGSKVRVGVPLFTITNTHPDFYWLPNFMETWLSAELWKPIVSATIADAYRTVLENAAFRTGGSTDFIQWQGHDFSPRGMSGIADAAKTGIGPLLPFRGTDNIPAVWAIEKHYGCSFIGGSVPATEHSVMCAGGEEDELETFRRLLKTYPSGIVSIVSDTWDFWNVISNVASTLRDEIMSRTPDAFGNCKVVFRPDSGDPVKIITGYLHNEYSVTEIPGGNLLYRCRATGKILTDDEIRGAVSILGSIFGKSTNAAGYYTLNPCVGLIYGDSITIERASEIQSRLELKGWASDNVVFGIGSFTYQYNTRDSIGAAMKATYVEANGVGKAIFKSPKTDDGMKKSAKGLLKVSQDANGDYILEDNVTPKEEKEGALRDIYLDGEILFKESFDTIRERYENCR